MRDEIAKIIEKETSEWDNAYWVCADAILALLKGKIEKSLLTDEEMGEVIRVNHDGRPFKSESGIALSTCQAQLDKVLGVLK